MKSSSTIGGLLKCFFTEANTSVSKTHNAICHTIIIVMNNLMTPCLFVFISCMQPCILTAVPTWVPAQLSYTGRPINPSLTLTRSGESIFLFGSANYVFGLDKKSFSNMTDMFVNVP